MFANIYPSIALIQTLTCISVCISMPDFKWTCICFSFTLMRVGLLKQYSRFRLKMPLEWLNLNNCHSNVLEAAFFPEVLVSMPNKLRQY